MSNHLRNLLLALCLLFAAGAYAQSTASWRHIHKVKKQETIFGIAKDYGVTIEAMLDANPEMKEPGFQLKKGDWVFVPYAKRGDKDAEDKKEGRAMLAEQKARPVLNNVVKVGVMLPIHLEDADGERMVEYYQGMALAMDSLSKQGINAEVITWNLAKDSLVSKVLKDPRAYTLDVIFGPLYSNQLQELSLFCKQHAIKLFVPFSIEGDELDYNPQMMQVYQSPEALNDRTVEAFLERFRTSHHPIIINCNNPSDGKAAFTTSLRAKATAAGMKVSLTNIDTPLADFAKQFSRKKPNVLVLNTARSPELTRVFAKLDSLTQRNPGLAISILGYNEWFLYQKHDFAQFCKYNTYIPSTYYYNIGGDRTEAFEQKFEHRWGAPLMVQCTPRMGITGFDHAMFVIKGIHDHGKAFTGTEDQTDYKPLQTRLKFKQVNLGGGYQNQTFQLIHFCTNQKLESISY